MITRGEERQSFDFMAIESDREPIYVDGGCSGNSQLDISRRTLVAVVTDCHGIVVREETKRGGSNNIAELWAVKLALEWAEENGIHRAHIYTDSRNNLSWVFGKKVGVDINDRLTVMNLKAAIEFLAKTVDFTMSWVPRDDNLAGHYIESHYSL